MQSIYTSVLEHGMLKKNFLLDYKGEENYKIVNYILDYEFDNNIELASQEELEKLGEFDYEFLPEKIMEAKSLLPKGMEYSHTQLLVTFTLYSLSN